MHLKVVNQTHYQTADLRAFIWHGLNLHGDLAKSYTVRVRYCRGTSSTSGYAYYDSGSILLRVPRRTKLLFNDERVVCVQLEPETRHDLAKTLIHEIAHTQGIRHGEMDRSLKRSHCGGTDNRPAPWAYDFQIRAKKADLPKTEEQRTERMKSLVATRQAKAEAALVRWERKLRFAKTKVAKYRRVVRGYIKRAEAVR